MKGKLCPVTTVIVKGYTRTEVSMNIAKLLTGFAAAICYAAFRYGNFYR